MKTFKHVWACLAVCGTAFSTAGQAHAGDPSQYYAGPTWTLGGVVFVRPKYEGSNDYEVLGAPYIFPKFSELTGGRLSVNGPDDLRYRMLEHGGFMAGPLAGYNFGRDEDDGDRLGGLGDVDGSVVLGAFAGYRFTHWLMFDVAYQAAMSGDVGGRVRFGFEADLPVSSQLSISARVGATYADDDYMETHFGINARQSAESTFGLAPYDAQAGIKDVHFRLASHYKIDPRWTVKLRGRYSRLIDDAADSPIVESADQFSGSLSLSYALGK